MEKQHQEWNEAEKRSAYDEWFWGRLIISALDTIFWIALALIQAGGSTM